MISNLRIGCPNVERKAYIFSHDKWNPEVNKLIGEFIEQENDAGEAQYLFRINHSVIPDEELKRCFIPGIDLYLRLDEYVRSGGIPYYMECSTIQSGRGDLKWWLNLVHLDYDDKFEFMLRTRAITHHSPCYLGRTPTDKIDLIEYKKWKDYQKAHFPNMPCGNPENDFHKIEER